MIMQRDEKKNLVFNYTFLSPSFGASYVNTSFSMMRLLSNLEEGPASGIASTSGFDSLAWKDSQTL